MKKFILKSLFLFITFFPLITVSAASTCDTYQCITCTYQGDGYTFKYEVEGGPVALMPNVIFSGVASSLHRGLDFLNNSKDALVCPATLYYYKNGNTVTLNFDKESNLLNKPLSLINPTDNGKKLIITNEKPEEEKPSNPPASSTDYYYINPQGEYVVCSADDCKKLEDDDDYVVDRTKRIVIYNGKTYTHDQDRQSASDNQGETDWGSVEDTNISEICASPSLRKPLKFIGTIVTFAKIIVPIVIIGFGLMDLYKAATSSKQDGIKNAMQSIMVRLIAGVAIFLLPGIVQMILNWVNEWSNYKNVWCCCTQCILDSNNCNVNSCSSKSCKIGGMNS